MEMEADSDSFCGESSLWNVSLLLNSSWPHFTQCFQSSILVFLPNGFLWLSIFFYLPYLLSGTKGPSLQTTPSNAAKTMVAVLLSLCTVIAVWTEVKHTSDNIFNSTSHFVARFIEGATYLLAAMLTQIERSCGVITSGVQFPYWLLLAVVDVIPLYSYVIMDMWSVDPLRVLVFGVSYLLILVELVLHASVADFPPNLYDSETCPEVTAPFLSRATFWWMTKLIVSGFKKPLEAADLWRLHPRDQCSTVVPKLQLALQPVALPENHNASRVNKKTTERSNSEKGDNCNDNRETDELSPLIRSVRRQNSYNGRKQKEEKKEQEASSERTPRFSLLRVMVKAYHGDVLLSYLCKLVSDLLQYLGPLLMGVLITHISTPSDQPWKGFVVATLMLVVTWLQTAFYHQHYHIAMTTGMRMKAALMAAIYKKSLSLSADSERESTVGQVVNMMSVDCQRIQDMMSYTWMVWSIPFQMAIAVYLLWDTLGPAVLAGVALLLVLVPVNAYLAYRQQKLQKENLHWKDLRLKLLNEIITGIKVLKLYAWETSFQEKVLDLRAREMDVLMKVAHQNAASIFIWTCAPYLVTLSTFATYVLSDDTARLDANKAFVTLSLFNILQFPIAFVPEMISFTAQAAVSIKRIDKFLKLEELETTPPPESDNSDTVLDCALRIERGLFTWDSRGRSTLHGINLDVGAGELIAVVGTVGSGKSSLVNAMLGEMTRRQGQVYVGGSVAYVPQQAWIQNASLRNNILFGKQFDGKRYRKAIDACALTPDLEMLPAGDLTEIGEKGINLSGGQRQRISVARAVYANRDVYLLDDPLSAVDSHVGKHIFTKVISSKGILRHKTRVLVTHAVHWLPLVDRIVLMQEGRVLETGSYTQLVRRDGALAHFLQAMLANCDDAENEEEDAEVRSMRQRMLEHVESVTTTTSASESTTSGDDRHRKRQEFTRTISEPNGSDDAVAVSTTAQLTEEEQAATGKVKLKVFSTYLGHLGRGWTLLILVLFSLYQACSVLANFWLTSWTQDPALLGANATGQQIEDRNHFFLTYYGLFGVAQGFFISLYAWSAAVRMTGAAKRMQESMLDSVLRSPMSFFDTTPSGRIVNRFARDVETVDNTLPQIVFMLVMCVFSVLSTLAVISYTTPYFIPVILPLAVGYYALQRFFVPSSRQLKRLEAMTRSPIFSHFAETLSGVSVIRAYKVTQRFVQESLDRLDKNQIFYFAGITANRWLGVWIEVISSCVVFAASLFTLLTPGVTGGQAGLSITYSLQITQALKWLVRTISDLETNVVSVERLQEYSELKPEAPRVTEVRPIFGWPTHGHIVFNKYGTRYRQGLDLVLKDITLNIKGGEKLGIVGRTGAGKSSLTLALFRLIEPAAGGIAIDGLDISSLGLHDLRSRLTVLPQDPVLFSGSLRMNLDPAGQFADYELWTALQLAHLIPFVQQLSDRLDYDCGEGGKNLSVGQRQLVCLARGLLRKTQILVLDEPTAAVDLETDQLIQESIRRHFASCTTITIAHRLNTIIDYDRVLVLDDGRVKEMDKPSNLLRNKQSLFYSLAHDAGLV